MLSKSRFNPAPGFLDLWNEIRRPRPYRWTFLAASVLPVAGILWWAVSQVEYKAPERPQIDYITSFAPDRSDAEIIASNRANQEVKELREAAEADIAERKRNMYKALGAAAGMDVDAIEAKAEAERAAEAAAEEKRRAELFGAARDQGQ
ncbi:MAG: hypothetical protein RSE14_07390 [Erythrobacter sp.]|jgi:hypothetical protein|uniref:hypothetical protein n=1 Tax=Erythrobacter sp. TaxID=1042 RepID=UPI002B45CCE0|nr:hypothetical protein [Erythrobacter sp.]WRH71895.1 MAG: hypothetical protein RSE14_07390 [Erythrobacter sp.]